MVDVHTRWQCVALVGGSAALSWWHCLCRRTQRRTVGYQYCLVVDVGISGLNRVVIVLLWASRNVRHLPFDEHWQLAWGIAKEKEMRTLTRDVWHVGRIFYCSIYHTGLSSERCVCVCLQVVFSVASAPTLCDSSCERIATMWAAYIAWIVVYVSCHRHKLNTFEFCVARLLKKDKEAHTHPCERDVSFCTYVYVCDVS